LAVEKDTWPQKGALRPFVSGNNNNSNNKEVYSIDFAIANCQNVYSTNTENFQ